MPHVIVQNDRGVERVLDARFGTREGAQALIDVIAKATCMLGGPKVTYRVLEVPDERRPRQWSST
jgi:hypothetical protein